MPTCAECKWGHIGVHSNEDKCAHVSNVSGFHPYALRHDATLCGEGATWFVAKAAPAVTYSAVKA